MKIHMKVFESDKDKMINDLIVSRKETLRGIHSSGAMAGGETPVNPNVNDQSVSDNTDPDGEVVSSLPPLLYKDEDPSVDGWTTFETPVMYMFAGKGPFVARDLMQFPVSHPDDGYIDVAIQEVVCGMRVATTAFANQVYSRSHAWVC